METKPEHPWNAFLEARKRAILWMRAEVPPNQLLLRAAHAAERAD